MNTTEVLAAINQTMDGFIETLSLFSEEQINKVPFKGSWTPGQVAQHVILSLTGMTDLLYGPDKETTRRPDEYVNQLHDAFMNFDIKMQSPSFIVPPAISYDKQELIATLKTLRVKLNEIIPIADMAKTSTAFEMPMLGYITRTEVAHFIVYHTARHLHQLDNIWSNYFRSSN